MVGERPGAGGCDVRDEGISSHRESAYCFCLRDMIADEVVEDEAGETATLGMEGRGAAVNVVVGLFATGQGKVAEFEGKGCDEIEQGGLVVCGHVLVDFLC